MFGKKKVEEKKVEEIKVVKAIQIQSNAQPIVQGKICDRCGGEMKEFKTSNYECFTCGKKVTFM